MRFKYMITLQNGFYCFKYAKCAFRENFSNIFVGKSLPPVEYFITFQLQHGNKGSFNERNLEDLLTGM